MSVQTISNPTAIPLSHAPYILRGVSWQSYVMMRALLDVPGLRMTYLKGMLELMSPSPRHEQLKKIIARLIEYWAIETATELSGYGSTTFRNEAAERGLEPDECYVVGPSLDGVPDIALEVVLSSGGIPKLEVYRGLKVPEVWFFEDDAFHVFCLEGDGYVPSPKSRLLPELDFALLTRCVAIDNQTQAVLALRDALRAES